MTSESAPVFSAGAGRARLVFTPDALPADGFGWVHDPLHARVVLFQFGDSRLALVVVDQTSLSAWTVDRLRSVVADTAHVSIPDVVVFASHTFSAPHISAPAAAADPQKNRLLQGVLEEAVVRAAQEASSSLRPAILGAGTGTCRVGMNRDVETPLGWTLGTAERGMSDPSVQVLSVAGTDGRQIAVLFGCAVQPSVMDGSVSPGGLKAVTADLAGAAAAFVESEIPGAVAVFLIGAAGDQTPILRAVQPVRSKDGTWSTRDHGDAGFVLLDLLGGRLGQEVVRVVLEELTDEVVVSALGVQRLVVSVPGQRALPRDRISPSRTYVFEERGTEDIHVTTVWIGDVAIVGFQAELSAVTGIDLRRRSPVAMTIVATMVDGAAKYLPDRPAYERATYEAMSSRYTSGAAEHAVDHVLAVLEHRAAS